MDIVILTIVGILAFGWVWGWIMTLIFGPSELSESDEAFLYLVFFTDIFDSHHDDD